MRSTLSASTRTFSVGNIRLPYVDGIFEKSKLNDDKSMEKKVQPERGTVRSNLLQVYFQILQTLQIEKHFYIFPRSKYLCTSTFYAFF